MTNTLQQPIAKMRLGAASVALALVAVLGLVVVTTQSAQAQTFTVLYSFKGAADGGIPDADLIMDAKGNLYGTTFHGGSPACNYYGCGVVFKLDPSKETVLYSFKGGRTGGVPMQV